MLTCPTRWLGKQKSGWTAKPVVCGRARPHGCPQGMPKMPLGVTELVTNVLQAALEKCDLPRALGTGAGPETRASSVSVSRSAWGNTGRSVPCSSFRRCHFP